MDRNKDYVNKGTNFKVDCIYKTSNEDGTLLIFKYMCDSDTYHFITTMIDNDTKNVSFRLNEITKIMKKYDVCIDNGTTIEITEAEALALIL